jgi:hypothetical protein
MRETRRDFASFRVTGSASDSENNSVCIGDAAEEVADSLISGPTVIALSIRVVARCVTLRRVTSETSGSACLGSTAVI